MLPKFSHATAGGIDCNLSLFHLPKDDKKAADNFFYHRLKTQVLNFNFRYITHLPICFQDKKIRAILVAFLGSFFARILISNYLIFSRFYLKNRIATKPTPKSLFFNDFNARRGIATPDFNSMVNDGNYPFRVHKGERRNRTTSSRPTMPYLRSNGLTLYQTYYSITYEHLFVKYFCETLYKIF